MDDELQVLRQLRRTVSDLGEILDRAIASRERAAAEREARRRRHGFRAIAIPALVGVGVGAAKWWFSSQARTAATAGTLAATATAAIAYAQLAPSIHRTPGRYARPPVPAAVSPAHPHRTESHLPVTSDGIVPAPVPRRQKSATVSPVDSLPPLPLASKRPAVPLPTTVLPTDNPRCRLKIVPPKLQLTCRRLVR